MSASHPRMCWPHGFSRFSSWDWFTDACIRHPHQIQHLNPSLIINAVGLIIVISLSWWKKAWNFVQCLFTMHITMKSCGARVFCLLTPFFPPSSFRDFFEKLKNKMSDLIYSFMIEIKVVRNVILNNVDLHNQLSRMHGSPPRSHQNFSY